MDLAGLDAEPFDDDLLSCADVPPAATVPGSAAPALAVAEIVIFFGVARVRLRGGAVDNVTSVPAVGNAAAAGASMVFCAAAVTFGIDNGLSVAAIF